MAVIFVVRLFREKNHDACVRYGEIILKSIEYHLANSLKLAGVEGVINKSTNTSFVKFLAKINTNLCFIEQPEKVPSSII